MKGVSNMANYYILFLKDRSITKNNVYIIVDRESRQAAIVDPACSIKDIERTLNRYCLDINKVLITHTHPDHIRSVEDVVKKYNSEAYVSRVEAQLYNYRCNNMKLFEDNDIITLGETKIKCLVTPGHTAGSSCFLLDEDIFVGDTIFMEGCGMCSSIGSSAYQMFDSINRIKHSIKDNIAVYPGHTYTIDVGKTIGFLKENNIYFMIDNRRMFIDFRMRKGQTNLYNFS